MKPTTTRKAWSITTPLAQGEMKARLDAAFGKAWSWGDSAVHGDYLGGTITPEAVVRIYEIEERFVIELRFFSTAGSGAAAAEQLAQAEAMTLAKVLPAIAATDVQDAETMD